MRPTSTKCIQIDASLHAKLEQVKAQTGQTITHLITQAIQFFLSENIHICNTQPSPSRIALDGSGRPVLGGGAPKAVPRSQRPMDLSDIPPCPPPPQIPPQTAPSQTDA